MNAFVPQARAVAEVFAFSTGVVDFQPSVVAVRGLPIFDVAHDKDDVVGDAKQEAL